MRLSNRLLKSGFLLLFLLPCLAQASGDRALFWSIEKDGQHAGYLLGTIHSEDPRVLDYTAEFLEKLAGSSRFAMELVPDLPTLSKLAQTMMLPEGQDLESIIGIDRYQAVAGALSDYGVPRNQLSRMKPWAAMMTLSVPPPQTGLFMDFSLSLRASGSGVMVIGLETLDQQLGFLEEMPLARQIEMLDQAVADAGEVKAVHDKMVDTYLLGNLDALLAETNRQLAELGEEVRQVFLSEGIDARNHRMLKSLIRALQEGTVFAAVGALHLPGENGLISLLRDKGYHLAAQPAPFRVP